MRPRRALPLPILLLALAIPPATHAEEDPFVRKLRAARTVFEELVATEESPVPGILMQDSHCIAVVPSVVKGALIFGGRRGRGVTSCRVGAGWSPPIFVKLTGGSVGLQAGGQVTDLVLFFLTESGARSLVDSKFILGADAGVAAGPAAGSAADADLALKAEIYSYARSRGLFAGAVVQGARLAPDHEWTRSYYGERVWPDDILFRGEAPRTSDEARAFLAVLP